MKKIMFNDKFGLTKAVLEGRKTQTRRIARIEDIVPNITRYPRTYPYAHYRVGEEVAIAQSYKDAGYTHELYQETLLRKPTIIKSLDSEPLQGLVDVPFDELKGWNNKLFVRADLMPHSIRITNVRVERLQDISEDDCLKEGIYLDYSDRDWDEGDDPAVCYRCTGIPEKEFGWPQKAFAYLIDKTCGKGTWDSNPWVFVYDFELIK